MTLNYKRILKVLLSYSFDEKLVLLEEKKTTEPIVFKTQYLTHIFWKTFVQTFSKSKLFSLRGPELRTSLTAFYQLATADQWMTIRLLLLF